MENKKPDKTKWELISPKLAVVSGILGIITTSIGIFTALKGDEKKALETKNLKSQLSGYEPMIEIAYVDVTGDIYGLSRSSDQAADKQKKFFLDYPVMNNELTTGQDSVLNEYSDKENLEEHSIYLMLENKGKSAATEIEIVVNRCILNNTITINEDMTEDKKDYENKIETAAVEQKTSVIKLPRSLESGQGILVPLMVSARQSLYKGPNRVWDIISKISYLPKFIQYKSAINDKIIKNNVRKMVSPMRLAEGVEIRG